MSKKTKNIIHWSLVTAGGLALALGVWFALSYCANDIHAKSMAYGVEKGAEAGYKKGYLKGYWEAASKYDITELLKKDPAQDEALEYVLLEKRILAIIDKSNPKLPDKDRRDFVKYIIKHAKANQLSPVLVASVIHRESNFNVKTLSKAGARGPMQVIPKWHREKLNKHKLKDDQLHTINYGVLIGCMVLKEYADWEKGNYRGALYRYVGGKHHGYVNDIFKMCEYAFTIKIS